MTRDRELGADLVQDTFLRAWVAAPDLAGITRPRAWQGAHCAADESLTATSAIHTGLGTTNTLEVRVVNNHFDFFINGTKVGQIDDSRYGSISGLMALDGNDGIEVVFSNLKIIMPS